MWPTSPEEPETPPKKSDQVLQRHRDPPIVAMATLPITSNRGSWHEEKANGRAGGTNESQDVRTSDDARRVDRHRRHLPCGIDEHRTEPAMDESKPRAGGTGLT